MGGKVRCGSPEMVFIVLLLPLPYILPSVLYIPGSSAHGSLPLSLPSALVLLQILPVVVQFLMMMMMMMKWRELVLPASAAVTGPVIVVVVEKEGLENDVVVEEVEVEVVVELVVEPVAAAAGLRVDAGDTYSAAAVAVVAVGGSAASAFQLFEAGRLSPSRLWQSRVRWACTESSYRIGCVYRALR